MTNMCVSSWDGSDESQLEKTISIMNNNYNINSDWRVAMAFALRKYDYERDNYEFKQENALARIWLTLTGRKPKDPLPGMSSESLSIRYVNGFNDAHGIGKRIDLGNDSSVHCILRFQTEDRLPVLSVTYMENGTGYVMKMKLLRNGGIQYLPCPFPYSEFCFTVQEMPTRPKVEELQKVVSLLPSLKQEIWDAMKEV